MQPVDTVPDIVRHLVPFFVTRQIICGAGRVGIGTDGRTGVPDAQRADFFEVEVGLETTLKRPIVNTRDEPHADADRYRRLHVIIGDANLAEISTYLKVGTTALVLAMIEANFLADDLGSGARSQELHRVSHDPSLQAPIQLRDGRTITALDMQGEYLERARQVRRRPHGDDADEQTRDVLARWESVLDRLASDPMRWPGELDWVAKLRLLEGYRDRDGLDWDPPGCSWSTCSTPTSVRRRACTTGWSRAARCSAADRRRRRRGAMRRRRGHPRVLPRRVPAPVRAAVAAASWDSVIFDVGRESLVRVPMLEPLRGTRHTWASCSSAARTAAGSRRRARRRLIHRTPPGDPECHHPGGSFSGTAPATSSTGGQSWPPGTPAGSRRRRARARRPTRSRPRSTPRSPSATRK